MIRTSHHAPAALAALVLLAGCGGAPAPAAPPAAAAAPVSGSADTGAFCTAVVDVEKAVNSAPPLDPTTMPPAEAQALLDDMRATLDPLLTRAEQTAPAEISGAVDSLVRLQRQALTGDFAAFESPEFATAEDELDAWMLAECGFAETAVTASDYEFQGLPESLPAGVSAITLSNEGEELHEIGMARVRDGVTMPIEELLALPMEEALSMVEIVGIAFAAPGETETTFVDATPGRYFAACFVPEGTVGDAEGSGPPHFTLGMLAEFTVA